ncbi:unnamed protein product [Symbiodinium microadriaticum]|nr:unnamed protein product [Symbiodinium microadriaticum]
MKDGKVKKRRQASGRNMLWLCHVVLTTYPGQHLAFEEDAMWTVRITQAATTAAACGAGCTETRDAVLKSLHLLPECIEELQRPVDPAPAMQPEADPDVVLARSFRTVPEGTDLDATWATAETVVGTFGLALKTAVERFRAMTVERQRNVLGLFDTPVYKFVRGSLQPDPEEQWPAEELFRAGSDTEAEDEVGNAEAVREEPLQVQEAGWEVLESGSDTDSVPPVTSDSDEATEASDVDEENEQARQNPDVRVEPEVGDGRDVPVAVSVSVLPEGNCQLARELDRSLLCYDFGKRRHKPEHRKAMVAGSWPPEISVLLGKEDGHMYYSDVSILASPTASWLLRTVENLEQAYSRLQLLVTPTRFKEWNDEFMIYVLPEEETCNQEGIDYRDGQTEMGLAVAAYYGLLQPGRQGDRYTLATAMQFRGLLFCYDTHETALAKGMLVVNPALDHNKMVLAESCIKARAPGNTLAVVLRSVFFALRTRFVLPELTPSVMAVLQYRIANLPTEEERVKQTAALEEAIAEARAHTEDKLPEKAWGWTPRDNPAGTPILQQPEDEFWDAARTPMRDISISAGDLGEEEEETQMAVLQQERVEAIGLLPDSSGGVKAISDPQNGLAEGHCHIVFNGRIYTGEDMAGGDLDGDEDFWAMWPKLIALLKATKDATESVPVKELEREVMAGLPQPSTAFDTVDRDARRAKLVTYSCGMSTMPIRGIAAILSERLTVRAVDGGGDEELIRDAVRANCLAHNAAMNAPKKLAILDVLKACRRMAKQKHINKEAARSSERMAGKLRLEVPSLEACRKRPHPDQRRPSKLDRDKVMKHFAQRLETSTADVPRCQIWLPRDRIVLGREAGRALRAILAGKKWQPHEGRAKPRKPLREIAELLRHKMEQRLDKKVDRWGEVAADEFARALNRRSSNRRMKWSSLVHTGLP